jgi:hypothetical protein
VSKPKLAQHVKLGDHELVVDGEDFPWIVAPNVKVTKAEGPGIYLVHVEIYPIAVSNMNETLWITCPAFKRYPLIAEREFPWLISKDGYRVIHSGARTRLRLAFLAQEFEDARSQQAEGS